MESTAAEIVAQILGPMYVVAGLGMVAGPERFAKMVADMEHNTSLTLAWGMVAMALGLLILAFFNDWRADWTVLITLIAWFAVIEGVVLILAPQWLVVLSRRVFLPASRLRIWAAFSAVLGGMLAAFGYGLA